ncbi:hypothetical protein E2C01_066833 [Portunus trituberculatus]|uniref:Uncharacterized protein n=1 Tax=Portunus trituberculatus TaxID=210409 RepID=A0A5B7HQX1_PORTR|nr:hypothetical protein [Portunus trituberculatus]
MTKVLTVPIATIMAKAAWMREAMFARHYNKDILWDTDPFQEVVLGSVVFCTPVYMMWHLTGLDGYSTHMILKSHVTATSSRQQITCLLDGTIHMRHTTLRHTVSCYADTTPVGRRYRLLIRRYCFCYL